MLSFNSTVKTVGANGQVSLGKHYAGKQIIIEEQEPGVLLIRTAKVIGHLNLSMVILSLQGFMENSLVSV